MNTFVSQAIAAIKVEQQRRIDSLPSETLGALDQWSDIDEPFINELCLLMLVGAFHQAERDLVRLSTESALAGRYTTSQDYHRELTIQRRAFRSGRQQFLDQLHVASLPEFRTFHALNLLANCYKHEPAMTPSNDLLDWIGLPHEPRPPRGVAYAPLPESHCFRDGLAIWLELDRDSSYCDIADEMLRRLAVFIAAVPRPAMLPIRAPVSLIEFEC